MVTMQACYELNTSCFIISGSIVYYSDRAVSRTTGNHVSIPDMGERFFSSPKISDISWGPPSLIISQPSVRSCLWIRLLGPEPTGTNVPIALYSLLNVVPDDGLMIVRNM